MSKVTFDYSKATQYVSEEDIKAKMDSGVLHITVAKKEEAKPEEKKIAIE